MDQPLVLLVEDDPDHTEIILESLRDNDITPRIDHVSDGKAALDYLNERVSDEKTGSLPNLILLDIRLPKVDGLTVLKQMKSSQELQPIPVVVLTTSAADADIENAYRNGANSYLVKPFEFQNFCDMVEDLELYWLKWNRRPDA